MTTSNLRISYINRADDATLTANPAAGLLTPVAYLQNDARGHLFAAAASGSQEIKGEWGGTSYTIGCVRLDRTNLVDGDTFRIQLYSDAAWTTQVYDSTAAAPFATDLYDAWSYSNAELFFTPQANVKSFKITVNSASAFQAARLFLGTYTTVAINPAEGAKIGWVDTSSQDRNAKSGTLSVDVGDQYRSLSFDMMVDNETDRAAWMEIGRYAGKRKTVWISVYPGAGGTSERDHSMLGKFADDIAQKISTNRYDFSNKLNEV